MARLTIRNIPDEVHRALCARAAQHGHSMEAEVREILECIVSPEKRVKLGSLLAGIGRQFKLTNDEFALFEQVRDKTRLAQWASNDSVGHERGFGTAAPCA